MAFSRGQNGVSRPTGRDPKIKASMYFAFGRSARPNLQSKTTFDAILAGERTSTTRFPAWGGYARWKALNKGDIVRFYEDREMQGRYIDVVIDAVEAIKLASCTDDQIEAWSEVEGWTAAAGRDFGQRYGAGLQIRYHIAALF